MVRPTDPSRLRAVPATLACVASMLLSIASAAAPAGAACVGRTSAWCWQNVAVTGNEINDVWFLDSQHGWAVGGAGTVLRSDDGGLHWQPQASDTTLTLDQVRFVDANRGWALSRTASLDRAEQVRVLRTVDGGAHWQSVDAPGVMAAALQVSASGVVVVGGVWPPPSPAHPMLADPSQHAVAVVSIDGGAHFGERTDGLFVLSPRSGDCWRLGHALQRWPACEESRGASVAPSDDLDYQSLASEDGLHAMATTRDAKLKLLAWRTEDGGAHWATFTPPVEPRWGRELPLRFVGDGHAWADQYFTDDDGQHWRNVHNGQRWHTHLPTGSPEAIDSGVLDSGGTQAAWGTYSTDFTYTLDAGATWHSGNLAEERWYGMSTELVHADAGLVVIKAESRWYRSADQGATWTRMLGPDPHTLSFRQEVDVPVFTDASHGVVVQVSRTRVRTDDGGRSWRRETDDDNKHQRLVGASFLSPRLGVAVGESHPVRTRDGGRTWSAIDVADDRTSLTRIFFLDERTGWTLDFSGALASTTDGGRHWLKPGTGFMGASDLRFRDPALGLAVTADDVQRSTDGGAHWQVVWRAEPRAKRAADALEPQAVRWFGAHGAIVPSCHGVLVSHDDGLTWRAVPLSTAGPLFDAAFTDERHGWMVGAGGRIFSTDDAGDTWVREDTGISRTLQRIVFTDPDHGWITAGDGVVLATTTGGHQAPR